MNVRRAGQDEDWAAIHRLVAGAFADMEGRIDPPSSIHRWTADTFADEAAEGAGFLIEAGGEIIACAFARPKGESLYLGKIAVARHHRGRGLTRKLVEAAMKEAASKHLTGLELQTRIELTENHALFAHLGFERIAETAHPGYDRPTSVTMRRKITP